MEYGCEEEMSGDTEVTRLFPAEHGVVSLRLPVSRAMLCDNNGASPTRASPALGAFGLSLMRNDRGIMEFEEDSVNTSTTMTDSLRKFGTYYN